MKNKACASVFAASLLGLLWLAGCQQTGGTTKAPLAQGFTCCNFHHEGDWISDSNYVALPMIPAGTPAKVTGYGRHRAYVEIDGKKMRLGHDYGREQESLEQWTAKMIVATDPKQRLAGYPKTIQDAIRAGKVAVGMTREQVIMAVGYPLTSENPSLDAPIWRMWVSSFGEYQLIWGADGKVKSIAGDPLTKNLIVFGHTN